MNYFKAVKNNTLLGVVSSDNFLRYQTKHQIMLACGLDDAQYVIVGDTMYHADWLKDEPEHLRGKIETVTLISITEEEYNKLNDLSSVELDNLFEDEPTSAELPEVNPDLIMTLEYIKAEKIKAMKKACRNTIINGFDYSGNHLDMSETDQINLIHALTVSRYKVIYQGYYYQPSELEAIEDILQSKINLTVAYYHCLKDYIKDQDNAEDVIAAYWGMPIPEQYQSEVYQRISDGIIV